jgi:hypothetical protein
VKAGVTWVMKISSQQSAFGIQSSGANVNKIMQFCAVVLFAGAVFAQTTSDSAKPVELLWEPPIVDWSTQSPQPTIPKPIISSLKVASLRVVLDETPMQRVADKLGMKAGRKGDAGESLKWLCFHGEDTGGRWMLWLQSGEMNGGAVGGFQWRRIDADRRVDSRCRKLKPGQFKLPIALRLGMQEAEVRSILGAPSGRAGDLLPFHHEHSEVDVDLHYSVSNTVNVLLGKGAVTAVEVWKVVSS